MPCCSTYSSYLPLDSFSSGFTLGNDVLVRVPICRSGLLLILFDRGSYLFQVSGDPKYADRVSIPFQSLALSINLSFRLRGSCIMPYRLLLPEVRGDSNIMIYV